MLRSTFGIFFVVILSVMTFAEVFGKTFSIVSGKQNQVCLDARKILNRIPKHQFSHSANGEWRSWFDDGTGWQSKTVSLRRLDGTIIPSDYSYASFDIDNDGKDELVMWETSMMSSVYVDFWYIFPKDNEASLLGSELSVSQLNAPQISGVYSSAKDFAPSELAHWFHKGTNYIAMREYGFGLPSRKNVPASFLVSKYEGVISRRGGMPVANVKILCEFK